MYGTCNIIHFQSCKSLKSFPPLILLIFCLKHTNLVFLYFLRFTLSKKWSAIFVGGVAPDRSIVTCVSPVLSFSDRYLAVLVGFDWQTDGNFVHWGMYYG